MATITIGFTAGPLQLQASRGLFSVEAPGTNFTKQGGTTGPLSIVTSSLANAVVGQHYSATLSATGGSGSYSWNIVTASPNTDLWLRCANSALYGIPQLTEVETIVLQVNDTLGNTAQATLTLNVTVTGALTIVAPGTQTLAQYYQGQAPVVGTIFSLKMLAAGGQPPYYWSFSGASFTAVGNTTATNYSLPQNGWLYGSPLASGVDTLTALVTDNNGATATQTISVNATASGLAFYPVDLAYGALNLPQATANTSYNYQFKVAGGTGSNQVYSIVSGALPSGLALSSTGLINGAPGLAGSISNCQIKCVDSGNNTQTISLYMNVGSQNKVARPSYNTSSAFFVDQNGFLRDPNGNLFLMRGLNRVHYDSDSWTGPAAGALAYPSVVRVFMFDGQTAAFAANQVQTQYAPNNIFTILVLAGISSLTPSGTTGQTSTTYITDAVTDWTSYFSALSPVMNQIAINIANEWGPSNSTVWRDTYINAVASLRTAGYTCPFVIDTGSSGEDPNDIINYAAAINNSDPLKNCIFSIHPYAAALPWQGLIQSVTTGNPTVLTLNSNWSLFPLNPGASTAGNNNFNFEYQITGAQGLTLLNGTFASDNKTYGSQNNWQVHLSVDSTAWVGNYVANSAQIVPATNTSSRNVDYRYLATQYAGLRSSGICTIFGEFGPGNQGGNVLGATQKLNFQESAPGQLISACEANQLGWLPWAWDDHSGTNTTFAPNYFNMVLAIAPGYGKYTANNQLTAYGLDIVGNPRYGVPTLAQPAPIFLPTIFQLTDQSGNVLIDQSSNILTG